MLNYVRQDEEFHCIVKLVNGTEIMGKCLVHWDDEIQKRVAFIQDPVEITVFINDRNDGKAVRGVGFTKWMQFSDEDFFIVTEDQIVSMASLSKDMITMYEKFLISEEEDNIKEEDIKRNTTPTDHMMGNLGTIEEARKKFEKIFKK